MTFGDPAEFAVEALLETDPRFGPVQGRQIVGRLRVWIGGRAIGRIAEPACWLGPPCEHLLAVRSRLSTLWDPSFDGPSPDAIFDRLDLLCFGAHRGRCRRDGWNDATGNAIEAERRDCERFVFLIHASEAFDGWKGFLVRPSATTLQALVADDSHDVVATTFPVTAFTAAVAGFDAWLAAHRRRLVAPE